MKKMMLTMLVCILFISLSGLKQSQASEDSNVLNGYGWQKLPMELQLFFLTGYLSAYPLAYAYGDGDGRDSIRKDTFEYMKNNKVCLDDFEKIKDYMELNSFNAVISNVDKLDKYLENKEVMYYKKEIESFYEAFPLCKSKPFLSTLNGLVNVWDKDSKATYKNVGDKCIEKK